jgi:XTP/dITP diphosphohydrolase
VMVRWEQLKQAEKPARTSVLDGIPRGMPALALAAKVLGRAEKVGVAVDAPGDSAHETEEELGRELLALVARSSAAGLDAERALRHAIRALGNDIRAAETAVPLVERRPEPAEG